MNIKLIDPDKNKEKVVEIMQEESDQLTKDFHHTRRDFTLAYSLWERPEVRRTCACCGQIVPVKLDGGLIQIDYPDELGGE